MPTGKMLGRLPSKPDPRTLRLAKYLLPEIPPPPEIRRWDTKISDWGTMGNDRYGNCVIVTAAHELLVWRANELDDTRRITDGAVIELSRDMGALDGFNILDRLKYWRKQGMWSNMLSAFAAVDPMNQRMIEHAVNLFGAADIGLNMPLAWQDDDVWDVGSGRRFKPGSWGGHSVPLVGYDKFMVYAVTWGTIQKISWNALSVYCDEAYALINSNWLAKDQITPVGLDFETLEVDLAAIADQD